MTKIPKLCLLVACLAIWANGATYYVSKTGNDASSGTLSAPFRTISFAYSKLVPGDTLIVRPGVYSEYKPNYGIHLDRSGTSDAPILLKSETPGGAIIDLLNKSDSNHGLYITGSYISIEGFKIRNAYLGGATIYGSHIQLLGNEIYNNGNVGDPASAYGQDGIFSDQNTTGNLYSGNYIHHNGRISINTNLDHGLYLCGNNETIVNNIITYNASMGIQIAGYDTVKNLKIYNNVVAFNGRTGGTLWKTVSGVEIKNNIFYKNARYGFDAYYSSGPGVVFSDNIFYGNANASPLISIYPAGSITITETNSIVADPQFVNDTADYHLKAGSPGINAGVNLSAAGVMKDFAGIARPQGPAYDIGAYEYIPAPEITSPKGSTRIPVNILAVTKVGTGSFMIHWSGQASAEVGIFSSFGKRVAFFENVSGNSVIWYPDKKLAEGIYLVRAQLGIESISSKMYFEE